MSSVKYAFWEIGEYNWLLLTNELWFGVRITYMEYNKCYFVVGPGINRKVYSLEYAQETAEQHLIERGYKILTSKLNNFR